MWLHAAPSLTYVPLLGGVFVSATVAGAITTGGTVGADVAVGVASSAM